MIVMSQTGLRFSVVAPPSIFYTGDLTCWGSPNNRYCTIWRWDLPHTRWCNSPVWGKNNNWYHPNTFSLLSSLSRTSICKHECYLPHLLLATTKYLCWSCSGLFYSIPQCTYFSACSLGLNSALWPCSHSSSTIWGVFEGTLRNPKVVVGVYQPTTVKWCSL